MLKFVLRGPQFAGTGHCMRWPSTQSLAFLNEPVTPTFFAPLATFLRARAERETSPPTTNYYKNREAGRRESGPVSFGPL
jgi:hypothetical protein